MEANDAQSTKHHPTKMIKKLNESTLFDAVIVANGSFPTSQLAWHFLKNCPYICCCDGAGATLIEHGLKPNAIIGDCDSLPQAFKEQYKDILHVVEEQDNNDLTKATLHCKSLGFKRILYVGATGKREDHTLGNISLMMRYFKEFDLEPVCLSDYGYFLPAQNTRSFETKAGEAVSIFNFSCTQLQSEGLKWSLFPTSEWWQGTLNKATNNMITIRSNGFYMLYFEI